MNTASFALAIFVKTPGLSPTKTRLAARLGSSQAEEFYFHSIACTREYVSAACKQDPRICPYWAVAEDGASHLWSGFPIVNQGSGHLGSRLSRVYNQLLGSHSWVFFIGADSPHLAPELLVAAMQDTQTNHADFVLGPTDDGGFYVFGGSQPVSAAVWEHVPYSTSDTAHKLKHAVEKLGRLAELPKSFDVDEIEDLARLKSELRRRRSLLPGQKILLDWLERLT